jgi:3-hydroxybutyryl-CoA dehydrogenase
MELTRVAVVGAGLLGTAIALDFALAGRSVRLHDTDGEALQRVPSAAREALLPLVAAGRLEPEEGGERVLQRLLPCPDLSDAVHDATLVVEAVYEDLELKRGVFADLDRLAPPEAVLASNSSSLMPSLLAAATGRPDRVLGLHYWNPAHLIPLVEVIPTPATAPALVEQLCAEYRARGKCPVVVRRELPGFIGNRLQFALLREALALVESGVATAEDVDTVVRTGFGRRLPITGVLRTADLAGLDTLLAICRVLFPELDRRTAPPPLLHTLVAAGKTGARAGAGFYEYGPGEAAALRARLLTALAQADPPA